MDARKAYDGVEPEYGELLRQIKDLLPVIESRMEGKISFTALFDALHCPAPRGKNKRKAEQAQAILEEARNRAIHIDDWKRLTKKSPDGGNANDRFRQFVRDHKDILGGYFEEKPGESPRYRWNPL